MTEPTGYRYKLPLLATCLLAFVIPFPFIFGSVGLITAVVLIAAFEKRQLLSNLRGRKLLWVPVLLYLWTLASWLWSTDKADAANILSTKLPLLILPVTLGASSLSGPAPRRTVLFSFAAGVAFIGLYCMGTAWTTYRASGDANVLFYHNLVSGMSANAVYMAWYVVTAILFLLFEPIEPHKARGALLLRAVLFLVLLPFFFLLAARTLLLLFLGIVLPAALLLSFRKKVPFPQKVMTWFFTGVVALAAGLALRQPAIQSRFKELNQSRPELSFLKHYQGEENYFSNMNVRLFLWRVGVTEMISSPKVLLAGTGVGDAHRAINHRVKALGIPNMSQDHPQRSPFFNINLHNTFLHTALATGLPGLVLLFIMAIHQIRAGLRQLPGKPFLLFFALLSFAFLMQEAVLETQAGAVFYLFMYSLFSSGKWASGVLDQPLRTKPRDGKAL